MRINFLTCRTITSLLLAATLLAAAEASASKITICHAPPGNPDNAHTITVNQESLPAHLAHGDIVGACPPANVGYRIDSAGGSFEYPGGLVLEVPPGAVLEPVTVELSLTDCGPLEPILNGRAFSTKPDKRCLAAFTGTPSGLDFNSPVLVRLPLAPLASGTIPILVDVDQILGTYQLLPTVIDYDGVSGVVQLELNGFSDKALASYEMSPEVEFGPEWAARGNEINERCGSCEAQDTNFEFCQDLDEFQDACCLIYPRFRACAGICNCCKELEAEIVITGVDFSSGDCQLLGSNLEVTYPQCPGAPTYKDSISEASDECGDDTVWEITVEPSSADILACKTQKFTAKIKGSSPNGSVVFEPATLPAFWNSTDKPKARFIDGEGLLFAERPGNFEVEARISANNPIDAVGRASVTVRSNFDKFSVDPGSAWLKVDESVLLEAQAVADPDASPPPDPNDTNWSSSDSSTATVTPAGSLASVRGVNKGSATITAKLDYLCETREAAAGITVECKEVDFSVSDSALHLTIGESHALSVSAIDSDGNVLNTTGVTWQSGAGTVVGLGNPIGSQTTVQALQPTVLGPVPVTATYDDGCQVKEAVTMVTVSCLDLELSVEEGVVGIDAFLPIAVMARNYRGDPVDIDESKIEWRSSDPNVAAVIPSVGSLTNVIGISPGTATITAEYDAGPCGTRTVSASIKVGNRFAGVYEVDYAGNQSGCTDPEDNGPGAGQLQVALSSELVSIFDDIATYRLEGSARSASAELILVETAGEPTASVNGTGRYYGSYSDLVTFGDREVLCTWKSNSSARLSGTAQISDESVEISLTVSNVRSSYTGVPAECGSGSCAVVTGGGTLTKSGPP